MAYLNKLLSADEKILVEQRPHWLVFVSTIVALAIQGMVFLALYQVFDLSRPPAGMAKWVEQAYHLRPVLQDLARQMPPGSFARIATGIALLYAFIVATTFFKTLLVWMTSLTVVTNVRVLQVRGLIGKTVVDSSLEKINDILLQQTFLGRLLGYGTLVVMTASETGLNSMYFLKNPVEFKRIMMEAKRKLSDGGSAAPRKENVADRLAELDDLRKRGLISAAEFDAKRRKVLEEI